MTPARLPFFVYGTLRPGEANHDLFLRGRIRSEEPGRLTGALLYDGPGYPYAVEGAGGTVAGNSSPRGPMPTPNCSPCSTSWRSTAQETRATCTNGSPAR